MFKTNNILLLPFIATNTIPTVSNKSLLCLHLTTTPTVRNKSLFTWIFPSAPAAEARSSIAVLVLNPNENTTQQILIADGDADNIFWSHIILFLTM